MTHHMRFCHQVLGTAACAYHRRKCELLHTGDGVDETALAVAHIIDLHDENPAWREIQPMANPRWLPNSVLALEGTLFVCGEGRSNNADPMMEQSSSTSKQDLANGCTDTSAARVPLHCAPAP